jgi:hypothetical protein
MCDGDGWVKPAEGLFWLAPAYTSDQRPNFFSLLADEFVKIALLCFGPRGRDSVLQ